MTDKLPPNLRALFAPRPPLRYLPPHDVPLEERRTAHISAVGHFVEALKQKAAAAKASDAGELQPGDPGYEAPPTESWLERRDRQGLEKEAHRKWLLTEGAEAFQPHRDANIRESAFNTLFIARLSYDVDKEDLRREFERYGHIERIRVVTDNGDREKALLAKGIKPERISKKSKMGAPKGYAFIVFTREDDMKGNIIT